MLINLCRVCGRNNICDRSLNLFEGKNRKLISHIDLLTGIKLRKSEEAPAYICVCCQSDLKTAMSFRKLCIKTQKKWQCLLNGKGRGLTAESDWETDLSVMESFSEKWHLTNAPESPKEPQSPLQILQVMLKEETTSAVRSVVDERDYLELDQRLGEEVKAADSKQNRSDEDCTLPKKNKNQVKNVPKHKNLQPYICELCGTHINTKASFERHMRKHTGDRPYSCSECSARFLSAAELRAHGLTHTGERPFACRYCDRKYTSYMGRLKHERVHTNERPFVCAECGKAFTNSYILKNHMLVHTGERLFKCDLCERSFQRKTHLRTHYRSNTHKEKLQHQKNVAVQEVVTIE